MKMSRDLGECQYDIISDEATRDCYLKLGGLILLSAWMHFRLGH